MDETAIKLFRCILDSQVFAHPIALKIWIWCLCRASYKERFIPLRIGKGEITVKLSPGQFIFGRFKAEEELSIDGSTIYKWMQKFASPEFNMISIESNNQYSIITICKWNEYQVEKLRKKTTKEQPKDNQVTTKEQPKNTNNNVDNVNNSTTWRESFDVYLDECKQGYKSFLENPEIMKKEERLNPGVNIRLTVEKGYQRFWGTEEGWKNKKQKKIEKINWERTISNSIDQKTNRVYLTKTELAEK